MRTVWHLLLALLSLGLLLAIFFFWLLIPIAGILLFFVIRYVFTRRRRRPGSAREFRLAHEAKAREVDIRR